MIIERTNNEILVRLPADVDLTELQNMLDYLKYKETTSKSKGCFDILLNLKDINLKFVANNTNLMTKDTAIKLLTTNRLEQYGMMNKKNGIFRLLM
jgi:hypothetical protein